MATMFLLDVETNAAERRARLRLLDENEVHLAAHEVALADHPAAMWSGLFDTRRHVARLREVEAPEAQLAALGRFLGEAVLGDEIAGKLAEGVGQRTVLVRLPDPTDDRLAAAFARVPWEIARAKGVEGTLLDRNVVVRAVPAGTAAGADATIEVKAGEAVRVLLVFAEAPGSQALAARLERERLLDLFFGEVLPKRDVVVDVLCHGVTRGRLREQVRSRGGYHVVHWSGHGHVDALEIAVEEGEERTARAPGTQGIGKGRISGKELVGLFSEAGGFIPPVVFLGACHSGALVTPKDWESLRDSLKGEGGKAGGAGESLDAVMAERVGFTGTALSLVRAGVKQVVAMRYEVGDRYARRLAKRFYKRLLADKKAHFVDEALALARGELARDEGRKGEYDAVDHANPMVFGGEPVRVEARAKRSKQMERRGPKPQPLLLSGSKELDPPRGFVGRGEELTALWRGWLEAGGSGAPIALVQGLAGLGKTSLAAEAVHLWFDRFDYVLCFQARGGALSIEEFYRVLDQRLALTSRPYRERCQEDDMAKVYLPAGPSFTGPVREGKLRENLIDALGAERVLLVLDNFETNLHKSGGPEYACQDPAWDGLLEALGDRLGETGSRVLVTSRHKLASLADPRHALWIPLGPLPMDDAYLFFEGQPPIRELLHGDVEAKHLAFRILDVSRGHPLILARIADLARSYHDRMYGLTPAGRVALKEALDKIQGKGYGSLPDVFVGAKTKEEKERQRAYLEDVAIGAVDLLIERLSTEERTLLWVVTRVGEPPSGDMIEGVWGAPASLLLNQLCASGLLVRDGDDFAFHELVAERADAWMDKHPDERAGRTEADIWTAYGTRYGALFDALTAAAKRDQASEAGRRGIRYLLRARAFGPLGDFASGVVTGTRDPALLGAIVADLQAAAGEVPEGQARWSLRTYLADGLLQAGRSDRALSFYAQAAEEAETAERWSDLGVIYGNWANALRHVGQLDRARETHLKSADAKRRAGKPRVNVVGSELEALRVHVKQGRAEAALPDIEAKLGEVRGFWASRQAGKPVSEAPDDEVLARTLVSGLDIARSANLALERWQPCLDLLGEIERVERALGTGEHEVARTRFNRYTPLMKLGKLAEAKGVLEGCLDVFHGVGDVTYEAKALSALASVWNALGDRAQAIALARRALALHERLPDPEDRATSHNNLASYLHADGATDEAKGHQLADLAYTIATGSDLRISLKHLTVRIRQSTTRGETFTFPPLPALLATPAFAPLRDFLAQREVPVDDLQARIDHLVEQTRAQVTS